MKQKILSLTPIVLPITILIAVVIWKWPMLSSRDGLQTLKDLLRGRIGTIAQVAEPKAEVYNKPNKKLPANPIRNLGWAAFSSTIGADDDVVRAMAVQTDYKLVLAGRRANGASNEIGLARLHPDGSFDTTFDTDGKLSTILNTGSDGQAHAVAIDAQGRIVIAGRSWEVNEYDFIVFRYLSNGALDTSFSSDGRLNIDLGKSDFGRAIAIQNDGKIVVAGYSNVNTHFDFGIARVNTDGSLDNSFGTSGVTVSTITTQSDIIYALDIDSNNKLIVSGSSNNGTDEDFIVARYDTDGSLDASFNGSGYRATAVQAADDISWGVVVDAMNRPVAVGRSYDGSQNDPTVIRYNTDGSLDNTFDGDGIRTDNVASGAILRSVGLDANNAILVTGRAWNGADWDFLASRYLTNGAVDTSFGAAGFRITTMGSGEDTGFAGAFYNEHIYAGGRTDNGANYDLAMIRYNSNGALAEGGNLDLYYLGAGGRLDVAPGGGQAVAWGFERNAQGRYLLFGYASNGYQGIMRYMTDGNLDTTFSGDGKVMRVVGGAGFSYGYNGSIQSDGKPIHNGYAFIGGQYIWGISRYNTDGSIDTSFATAGDFTTQVGSSFVSLGIGVKQDSQGRLVGVGSANFLADFGIVRLLSNGTADTSFNTTGIQIISNLGTGNEYLWDVAFDSSDRVLAVGPSGNNMTVIRLNATGQLDTSFNGTGINAIDDGGNEIGYAVRVHSDGKIYVAGTRSNDFAIARLNTDGTLDTAFGGDGFVNINGGGNEVAYDFIFQQNGKILLTGARGGRLAAARLFTDGTVDTCFGTNGVQQMTNVISYGTGGGHQEPDGRIFMGGYGNSGGNRFLAARIWP